MAKNWFEVDRAGLAELLGNRGPEFVAYELIQNAWDEEATEVVVDIERHKPRGVLLRVSDNNPEGFTDLTDAFTLFRHTRKRANPEQRGRFNIGEKLVLAGARNATIATTKGTIEFDDTGRHEKPSKTLPEGSLVTVLLKLRHDDVSQIVAGIRRMIPPPGVHTTLNGEVLPSRKPVAECKGQLATVIECDDPDNFAMRDTRRNTIVEIHEVAADETACIYEMGIPVVATGDKFHYNVMQKVPLTIDRDNVPPSFLRDLRTLVLNTTHALLNEDDCTEAWVKNALEDRKVNGSAVKNVIDKTFGPNAVTFDPSDIEGTHRSVAEGRTVIPSRSFSKKAWEQIRNVPGLALPAGQVTPSPNPFSKGGKPEHLIPKTEWTEGMQWVASLTEAIAKRLLNIDVNVKIANDPCGSYLAHYGGQSLTFNLFRCGRALFDGGLTKDLLSLIVHELAHESESNHLSTNYHEACCDLGAKLTILAIQEPKFFKVQPTGVNRSKTTKKPVEEASYTGVRNDC